MGCREGPRALLWYWLYGYNILVYITDINTEGIEVPAFALFDIAFEHT